MNSTDQNQLTGDGTPCRPILLRGNGKAFRQGHHLELHRSQYRLRATIDNGRLHSGTRIVYPLGTCDQMEAEKLRDVALAVLTLAGCLAKDVILTDGE